MNKICPPPWVPTDPSWVPAPQNNFFFETPYSFVELNTALGPKRINSAPGMDGLDFEIIKNLAIKFRLILLDIFNEMHLNSDFPHSWKYSYIHFVKKTDSKSLRPISLTSCLGKLFKTLLKSRLQWWTETNELIPNC